MRLGYPERRDDANTCSYVRRSYVLPVETSREVVAAYWAAAERRDWDAFGALVAEDVVYEAPQSRERVRGREAYVRFNRDGFPGEWHLVVERIVGEGREATSLLRFTDADGTQPGLCFFELDDEGLIARITDFWPEPYEPPAGRAHLVERY
jgi:predicted ester cyclase